MYILDENDAQIIRDAVTRILTLKAGPGIAVANTEHGITISAIPRAQPIPQRSTPQRIFPCWVVKDGGADGDASTAATWTYSVYELDETTLMKIDAAGADAEEVPVSRPRPNGEMVFQVDGGYGVAFRDADGNLILWDAGEVVATCT